MLISKTNCKFFVDIDQLTKNAKHDYLFAYYLELASNCSSLIL